MVQAKISKVLVIEFLIVLKIVNTTMAIKEAAVGMDLMEALQGSRTSQVGENTEERLGVEAMAILVVEKRFRMEATAAAVVSVPAPGDAKAARK